MKGYSQQLNNHCCTIGIMMWWRPEIYMGIWHLIKLCVDGVVW